MASHHEVMTMYHDLDRMHHPPKKSIVRGWIDAAMGHGAEMARHHGRHLEEHGMHAVRQYSETIITGALLGVVSAESKTGLDMGSKKIPLDGVIGLVGLLGKLALGYGEPVHGEDFASDAGNVGSFGAGLLTFRKFESFLRAKRGAVSGDWDSPSGETGEETSIEQLARSMG